MAVGIRLWRSAAQFGDSYNFTDLSDYVCWAGGQPGPAGKGLTLIMTRIMMGQSGLGPRCSVLPGSVSVGPPVCNGWAARGPVRVGSRTSKEPRKTGRSKLRVVRPLQQRRIRVTVTSLPPGPSFLSKVYQRKAAQRVLDNDQNRQKVTIHDIFGQIRANKNIRILYGQTKGFLGHNINYTVPSHAVVVKPGAAPGAFPRWPGGLAGHREGREGSRTAFAQAAQRLTSQGKACPQIS